MEILTGVERRRRWSVEDKLEILRETELPGASVAAVAARREVCRSQIYQWRRQARCGELHAAGATLIDFLPVTICVAPKAASEPDGLAGSAQVAIILRCGRELRVPSDLPCAEIRRLVAAVETA